jgi:hypothetical protein
MVLEWNGGQTPERSEDRRSEGEGRASQLRLLIIERWPHIIFWTGLLLFWLACIDSAHLPFETVLVGPALMLAGVIMMVRDKREMR